MNNPLAVLRVFARILLLFSLTLLIPMALAGFETQATWRAFRSGFLVCFASAVVLWALTHRARSELRVGEGYLLVSLVWVLIPAFAAIPLLLYLPGLSFSEAYFETVSGLTTTGATLLRGLDTLPFSIHLWRSGLTLLGGMGLIVLAVAVLPLLGVGGRQLHVTETPGPIRESRLLPRMRQTMKSLWMVYFFLGFLCLLAYAAAGMKWRDALLQTFSTLSLGGFTSHDASFAYFDSVRIEAVSIVFMILAGMNFATHYLALHRGSLSFYRFDPEIRWYLGLLAASVLAVAVGLWQSGVYPEPGQALRFAAFNVVSLATTAGFVNADFSRWPILVPLWMLFLSSFLACSGSTGGGIRLMRAIIVFRQVLRELVRTLHPNTVRTVKLADQPLPNRIVFAVLAFSFIYMVVVVSLTLLLVLSGLDVVAAFSVTVSSLNNVGAGLGGLDPATGFAGLSRLQIWLCTLAMLLGRLEIFALLVVVSPAFWRK